MKPLFQRIISVFLAALLCGSIILPTIAVDERKSPACVLGTLPSDMLAGGGRRVQAEECVYYIDDTDGCVYDLSRPYESEYVLEGPAAKLNYADGVLYFVRSQGDVFDICALEIETGTERVLLSGFSGWVGQLYLVDGETILFSCGDTVWELPLAGGDCRAVLTAQGLWSFVPTGCGLIYATGSLFDYSLYANGALLARHVEDYTVRYDLDDGILVYSRNGKDYQLDLTDAFSGIVETQDFEGLPIDPDEENEIPGGYVPDPVGTILWYTGEASGNRLRANDGAIALFPDDQPRLQASEGTLNIVRRARQMLNVQWTPVNGIPGWGYTDLSYDILIFYDKNVTYTGLPYGQGMSYVPWYTSYGGFLAAVNDPESKLYTERCNFDRGCQYFGTDCSGFASWAWETTQNGTDYLERKTCQTLMGWENTVKVGRSYTDIKLGDTLISPAHAVLVTDVAYNLDGSITSIEISQANPTSTYNGCCYSTRYTGTNALQSLNNSYFVRGGYSIYRNKDRDSVTYTHDCCVPIEGDVCPICGYGMDSTTTPDPTVNVGIDVSENNGTIDWSSAAQEVDFAIVRVGYTGYTEGKIHMDSDFVRNVQGCIDNNIPFGLYYYAGATTSEKARQEADAILSWLLEKGITPSLPIFYDVEETKNILTLNNTKLAEVCSAFCGELEDFGFRAGVYASADIWNNRLKSSAYDSMAHWVAHWDTLTETAAPGASLWQYSSTGTVSGVPGDVDMDYWVGTLGDTEHPSTITLTAPSCVDANFVSVCVRCGLVQKQLRKGEGHTPGPASVKTNVAPTCTEPGLYEEITLCSVCGETVSQIVKTQPALGHAWSLTEVLTQGESGHKSTGLYTCSRCKETKEAPLCAKEVFTDMPKNSHWAHSAIDWAYFHGLFAGVSDNVFGLDITMDRAMLVTVLYSLAGRPPVDGENPFRDVKKKDYFYNPVRWACQVGVAGGTGNGRFSPNAPVTREQVAVMLLGYFRSLGQDPEIHLEILQDYPDTESISSFAQAGMAWAVENGILSGSPVDGTVCLLPRNSATRAQVAVMFMQFTKLLQSMELWNPDEIATTPAAPASQPVPTEMPQPADPVD